MKLLSILAASVLLLGLAGCDGSPAEDRPVHDRPAHDRRVSTAPVDELVLHDGAPCPEKLPRASAATFGLGTFEQAQSAPHIPVLERAWVCVYDMQDTGTTTGEWVRGRGPVRVASAELRVYERQLAGVRPADADLLCRSDLGLRHLFVYAQGADLTGVAVDDFGCAHVRLTDDPFLTVPGDATQDGTVSGALKAPPDLLAHLKSTMRADRCPGVCD